MHPYNIEPWKKDHDSVVFSSGFGQIDRYIKEQAHRDMSSKASLVFVLTESGNNIIRAYYSLSSLGIVFTDLPEKIQKRLPRYPQIGATLLGRLGVDRNYSAQLLKQTKKKPRLGELLLMEAQEKALAGANSTAGSALLVVDVLSPTAEEVEKGARDPMSFYTNYGFRPFPGNERRLFKLTRDIEQELAEA
jgi:hypothetical protein